MTYTELAENNSKERTTQEAPVDLIAKVEDLESELKKSEEEYNAITDDPKRARTLRGKVQDLKKELNEIKEGAEYKDALSKAASDRAREVSEQEARETRNDLLEQADEFILRMNTAFEKSGLTDEINASIKESHDRQIELEKNQQDTKDAFRLITDKINLDSLYVPYNFVSTVKEVVKRGDVSYFARALGPEELKDAMAWYQKLIPANRYLLNLTKHPLVEKYREDEQQLIAEKEKKTNLLNEFSEKLKTLNVALGETFPDNEPIGLIKTLLGSQKSEEETEGTSTVETKKKMVLASIRELLGTLHLGNTGKAQNNYNRTEHPHIFSMVQASDIDYRASDRKKENKSGH
jgi:hypothetical protein